MNSEAGQWAAISNQEIIHMRNSIIAIIAAAVSAVCRALTGCPESIERGDRSASARAPSSVPSPADRSDSSSAPRSAPRSATRCTRRTNSIENAAGIGRQSRATRWPDWRATSIQLNSEIDRLQNVARPELVSLLQAGIAMDLLFRTDESVLADTTGDRLGAIGRYAGRHAGYPHSA